MGNNELEHTMSQGIISPGRNPQMIFSIYPPTAHGDSSISGFLCPFPALPEEQRHHGLAPETSPTPGLCRILSLRWESATEKRKLPVRAGIARTWALLPAQPKKTPSLLGLGCTGEKIHPKPRAMQTAQRAKPQRDPRVAKIHPWPKDRPFGTILPSQHLKKKKTRQKAET